MTRFSFALLASTVLTFGTSAVHAQESRFASLIGQIDAVSEDALGIPASVPPALVGSDCEVDDDRVEELDQLLQMSGAAMAAAEARHARWGLPVPEVANDSEKLLHHPEYLINHNGNLRIPLWASYRLDASDVVRRTRLDCFRKDVRLEDEEAAILDDYDEPTFDRGHLVPRADMNRSEETMLNTFVLSNMMPQYDNFNQGVWRTFESSVRAWAKDTGSVHVVTGAIFDKEAPLGARDSDEDAEMVWPLFNLGIPTHFYKIVLHERPTGYVEAIAILLPHTDEDFPMTKRKWEKLAWMEDNITSIDEIELLTGYDFFPDMPESQQRAVERSIASGLWQ